MQCGVCPQLPISHKAERKNEREDIELNICSIDRDKEMEGQRQR